MTILLNELLQGDCLDILPTLASECVNLVLTDPPYLARYVDRSGRSIRNDDNEAWLKPAFAEIYRVLARDSYAGSFYGWPQADRFIEAWRAAGFRIAGHLVFPKRYPSNSHHVGYWHECAYLLAKGAPRAQHVIPDVLPWEYTGNRLHPTEKPLAALTPSSGPSLPQVIGFLTRLPVPALPCLPQNKCAETTSASS